MLHITCTRALYAVAIGFFLLALAPAASAQQPSRELQSLQDTTRDLYQAGAYDEALQYADVRCRWSSVSSDPSMSRPASRPTRSA